MPNKVMNMVLAEASQRIEAHNVEGAFQTDRFDSLNKDVDDGGFMRAQTLAGSMRMGKDAHGRALYKCINAAC